MTTPYTRVERPDLECAFCGGPVHQTGNAFYHNEPDLVPDLQTMVREVTEARPKDEESDDKPGEPEPETQPEPEPEPEPETQPEPEPGPEPEAEPEVSELCSARFVPALLHFLSHVPATGIVHSG